MVDLIYKDECYHIIGACFNVYKDKGSGFLEPVYQECLAIEFDHSHIPFEAQKKILLTYRGKILSQTYIPDFICYDKIIVEIKAAAHLMDEHRAQLLNYLNATGMQLGLLVNFGHYPKVGKKRIMLFPPEQTKNIYRVPFSFSSLHTINYENPDYKKYPALKNLQGQMTELCHGDVLYIPSGYWHYVMYDDIGFSMALRAFPRKPKPALKLLYNLLIVV